MLKGPKDFLNLRSGLFVIFFDHSERKLADNFSVSVVSEIFTLFVHIMTPDEKYSLSVITII